MLLLPRPCVSVCDKVSDCLEKVCLAAFEGFGVVSALPFALRLLAVWVPLSVPLGS